MDAIQHKFIAVRGLNLHVAQIGSGPKTVIFLHGFPEIWYSWRHQMPAIASAGYRAIAPDYRGYGLSDQPTDPEKTTFADLVADTVSILDHYSVDKVFVVAKDFGVRVAYLLAKLHPSRVRGIVTLGIAMSPVTPPMFHTVLPEGFYILRWQVYSSPGFLIQFPINAAFSVNTLLTRIRVAIFRSRWWFLFLYTTAVYLSPRACGLLCGKVPGRAEADFGRFDARTVVKNIYTSFAKSEIPIAAQDQEILDLVDSSAPLPPWLTEDDITVYGDLYEKSGFRTALQVPYRSLGELFEIADPRVEVPSLLILGEKDYCMKFPGFGDYINSGTVNHIVPDLEIVRIPEGCHFVQEQFPETVNSYLISFLSGH